MPGTAFETRLTSIQDLVRQHLGVYRVAGAQHSGGSAPLRDLEHALETLQVAAEELRHQNEELVATRGFAEEQCQRYRELFDLAPDAYLVTDPRGLIQEANWAAAALLGVPRDRLVGKPLLLYFAPEHRRDLDQLLDQPAGSARTEVRLLQASGTPVPAALSVTEVREPGAERRGLRFLLRDLSTIERAACELRESEASFRTVFEHSFPAILLLDDDGQILESNPAAWSLTGLDRGQLLGRRMAEFLLDNPPALGESVRVAKLRRGDGTLRSLTLSRQEVAPGRHLVFAMDVTALEAVTADRDLLRALAAHRFEAQEEASRRIARELHDDAGEVLTSVHLRLDQLTSSLPAARASVREVRSLLDEVEQRLRRISHELRPIILDDLGLVCALELLVEGAASRTKTRIVMEGREIGRLPPAVESALYRIAQEALANALRHARAKRIRIRMRRRANVVILSIEDDGVGLDTQAFAKGCGARRRGLGLAGIRERAENLGGALDLRSGPRRGLEVRVRVPL